MDFEFNWNSNFTSLLQQGTQQTMEDSPVFEMSPDVMEESLAEKRGKNFNPDEDKLLVSAWLNTSLDSADGNNMKADRFWNRIEMYFIQGKIVDCPARTLSSLKYRWGVIQHAVNKFCGFLTQVEARHRSGVSNEDNIQEARRMYLAIMKNPFRFDHCWVLLKDQEKWKKRDQLSGIKRKLKLSGPSKQPTPETINVGEDCEEPNEENNNKRPGGRKAAKEKKKLLGDVSGFRNILAELKEEKHKIRAEKIEKINLSNEQKFEFLQLQKSQLLEARETNRIRNEKVQLERDREDTNIMMKDLSSMDSEQQEYFRMRRMEIRGRKYGDC